MFDAKFSGMDQLIKKSRGLSHAVRVKIARGGVMAGARVIAKQARQNAMRLDDPETGRSIAKNVATRYRRALSEQSGDPTASVGVLMTRGRIPKGNPDKPENTNHFHLLELGTEKMAARPFLVPSAKQAASAVPQKVADAMSKGIDRELKKL